MERPNFESLSQDDEAKLKALTDKCVRIAREALSTVPLRNGGRAGDVGVAILSAALLEGVLKRPTAIQEQITSNTP